MQTSTKGRRRRVLLIAEAANPEWVSVPLIGWSLSRALTDIIDTHLVTQIRNRPAILRAGLAEGVEFTAIDNETFAAPIYKLSQKLRGGPGKGWTTAMAFSSLAYYSFEYAVWRHFKRDFEARKFDLVHRITPVSPTSPSIIAKRLAKGGVPFVIGPLNGGLPWPKGFMERRHAEKEWLSHIRKLHTCMPGYHNMRRYSSAIIVGSKYALSEMPDWTRHKCFYIPENGVDLTRFSANRNRVATVPLRGVFVGRLVPYKGADMLLEAASEFLKKGQLHLEIVGNGPQRPLLESMVDRLDVRQHVRFHNWVPHIEVEKILSECDFMALPSIREFGGGVVVEAMALGVTPIVANYGGPSELVNDETGIRVPFQDRGSLIAGLKGAIGEAIAYPEILDRLGAAGRLHVQRKLTWNSKADQIAAIYDKVLDDSKNQR